MTTLEAHVAAGILLAAHAGIGQVRLILVNLGVRAVQSDRLQSVKRLLVLFRIHSIIELLNEEIVVLAGPVMLVLEGHEVLLALVDVEEIEWCRDVLRDLGLLIQAAHGLPHLLLVIVVDAEQLVRGRYLSLTDLVRILHF